jgi:hypothetical protein
MKKKALYIGVATFAVCIVGLATLSKNGVFASTAQNKDKIKVNSSVGIYESIEKSKPGIEKYVKSTKEKNEKIVNGGIKEVSSTITFAKALSFAELKQYIDDNMISEEVKFVSFRAIQDGERITGFAKFSNNLESEVNKSIEKMQTEKPTQLIGFTDIKLFIQDPKKDVNMEKILNDSNTYLFDPSADSHFTEKEARDEFAHPLTWILEDLNLLKK